VLKVTSTDNSNDKCPMWVPFQAHKQCQETNSIWSNTHSLETSLFVCQCETYLCNRNWQANPFCIYEQSTQANRNKTEIDLLPKFKCPFNPSTWNLCKITKQLWEKLPNGNKSSDYKLRSTTTKIKRNLSIFSLI